LREKKQQGKLFPATRKFARTTYIILIPIKYVHVLAVVFKTYM